ncbi:Hypothetical_protein [Hexamita inflata]|uniref:Hypothetical_protein n=1 Tax=Hexamita inflata TaxID=28002 RepID=A0AA86R6G4_9EUKA|nr:Hypothetical protein HINF_LOCUS55736 [Hexamita inflata]
MITKVIKWFQTSLDDMSFLTNSASKGGLEMVVPSLYYDFIQAQQKAVLGSAAKSPTERIHQQTGHWLCHQQFHLSDIQNIIQIVITNGIIYQSHANRYQ